MREELNKKVSCPPSPTATFSGMVVNFVCELEWATGHRDQTQSLPMSAIGFPNEIGP